MRGALAGYQHVGGLVLVVVDRGDVSTEESMEEGDKGLGQKNLNNETEDRAILSGVAARSPGKQRRFLNIEYKQWTLNHPHPWPTVW